MLYKCMCRSVGDGKTCCTNETYEQTQKGVIIAKLELGRTDDIIYHATLPMSTVKER